MAYIKMVSKIDSCDYCKEKAEYLVYQRGFWEGTFIRMLCKDHTLQYRNNTLRF